MTDSTPFLPPHLQGQSSWFSRTTSARILGHPLVWSAVTGMFIVFGYLWLQYYAQPLSEEIKQSNAQNEVFDQSSSSDWKHGKNQSTDTESIMSITRHADTSRADKYRDIVEQENLIQPLLATARQQLDKELLTGPDENNAWVSYQAILDINPQHKLAHSGQAQILKIIEGNAILDVEGAHYEQAERWLNKLDAVRANHSFQADLRKRIADQIGAALAEAEAARHNAERLQLLQNALTDAKSAMSVSPPKLRAAYDLYQRALELDENNLRAKAGLEQIYAERTEIAKLAIARGDYGAAHQQINRLQKIGASNLNLERLKAAIQSARNRATAVNNSPSASSPSPSGPFSRSPITQAKPKNMPESAPQQAKLTLPIEPNLSQSDKYAQLLSGIDAYYAGNYDLAFERLHPLAEEDVARAQFRLGIMYNQGRTVVRNRDLAQQWIARALPTILRAAQNKEAWAQADLGTAYELGIGVRKNMEHAANWYQKAADQGYAGAQTNLGVLYGSGYGVQYDRQRALHWLQLAAEQGDIIAKDNLKILNAR